MADQEKTDAVNAAEDTKTRKTVKLKLPTQSPTAQMNIGKAAAPIVDPLGNRDTDTGNLDILSDTQTRKTVKLKPLTPKTEKHPINLDAAATVPSAANNTHSRKVVMLKPTPARPAMTPAPAADGDNDETVKVAKLAAPAKPGSSINLTPKTAPVAPGTAPSSAPTIKLNPTAPKPFAPPAPKAVAAPASVAPAAAGADEDTIVVQKVAPAPAAPTLDGDDDQTVKMQRPTRPAAPKAPVAPVAPAAAPKAPAAAPAPIAATAVTEDDKATVKLARPTPPVPPASPVTAAPKVEAPVVEEDVNSEEELGEEDAPVTFDFSKHIELENTTRPSKFYTAVAVITLILLAGSAALSGLQFFQLFMEK